MVRLTINLWPRATEFDFWNFDVSAVCAWCDIIVIIPKEEYDNDLSYVELSHRDFMSFSINVIYVKMLLYGPSVVFICIFVCETC